MCQHYLWESDRDLYVILLIRLHPHWSLECQRWSGLRRKSFNLDGALHHQRAPQASLAKHGTGNWIWEGNWLNFRNIIWRSKWALFFWFHLRTFKCSSQDSYRFASVLAFFKRQLSLGTWPTTLDFKFYLFVHFPTFGPFNFDVFYSIYGFLTRRTPYRLTWLASIKSETAHLDQKRLP